MIDRHLTDKELQLYLDEDPACHREWIETHLELCEQCREELLQYRQLYSELERDAGFELPPEFADSVISKIPDTPVVAKESRFLQVFISICGVIAALSILLYFTGLRPWLRLVGSIHEYMTSFIMSLSSGLSELLSALNLDSHLLLYVAIVVGLILLLDRAYLHKGKPAFRTK